MNDHKARLRAQFGASSAAYVTSATHAAGDDLSLLASWSSDGPRRHALDIATGGGHTALALSRHCERIVATDLTARMLATAMAFLATQGATNVSAAVADAEQLPFSARSFDLVACRIAPHHFGAVEQFVAEAARVLVPGGLFLLEDSVAPEAPEDADFLNVMEALRDPTHVRSLRQPEWRELLRANGFDLEAERLMLKRHPFKQWVTRSRTPPDALRRLTDHIRAASPATRAALQIEIGTDGEIVSYTDQKVLYKARRGVA